MHARQSWLAGGIIGASFLGGFALLAWPGYRESYRIAQRLESLRDKVESLPVRTTEVERLVREVADIQQHIAGELRAVPADPDVASLFRRLSLPVDGVRVADQTFASGSPVEAVSGADLPTLAMPVTVKMQASFDSIFTLVRSAELMPRLVRVASLELVCERPTDESDPRFLAATVELEAIYEDEDQAPRAAGGAAP